MQDQTQVVYLPTKEVSGAIPSQRGMVLWSLGPISTSHAHKPSFAAVMHLDGTHDGLQIDLFLMNILPKTYVLRDYGLIHPFLISTTGLLTGRTPVPPTVNTPAVYDSAFHETLPSIQPHCESGTPEQAMLFCSPPDQFIRSTSSRGEADPHLYFTRACFSVAELCSGISRPF